MDIMRTRGQEEIMDAGARRQQGYQLRHHAGRSPLFKEVYTVRLVWNGNQVSSNIPISFTCHGLIS